MFRGSAASLLLPRRKASVQRGSLGAPASPPAFRTARRLAFAACTASVPTRFRDFRSAAPSSSQRRCSSPASPPPPTRCPAASRFRSSSNSRTTGFRCSCARRSKRCRRCSSRSTTGASWTSRRYAPAACSWKPPTAGSRPISTCTPAATGCQRRPFRRSGCRSRPTAPSPTSTAPSPTSAARLCRRRRNSSGDRRCSMSTSRRRSALTAPANGPASRSTPVSGAWACRCSR